MIIFNPLLLGAYILSYVQHIERNFPFFWQNVSLLFHLTFEHFAMNSIKIFLRTDQVKMDGTHAVSLRLISRRRKKDVSLRIYVKLRDWSMQRCLVNRSDPMSERKNRLITKFKNKALNIVDDYFFRNELLSFDDFEKELFNKEYSDDSFIEFALDEISKRDYSKESKRNYTAQITKLKQFKKNLLFSEINFRFINDYKSYMLNELKNNLNTANKSLSRLKTFINWSIEAKLMKDNPFEKIRLTKVRVDRVFLSVSELESLELIYKKGALNDKQKNVLRYFLFVCYTGLRYSDIKNLRFSDLKKRLLNNEDTTFIEIQMQKTSLNVSVPVISKAMNLLPEKISSQQKVFRVLSNQKTNEYLKEIIRIAGIDKKITFHSARHTLATTGLEMGIPIEVISKILGHTELKMTQIYAKVNDSLKYREMLKLDKKVG